jgi:hypothetical protein
MLHGSPGQAATVALGNLPPVLSRMRQLPRTIEHLGGGGCRVRWHLRRSPVGARAASLRAGLRRKKSRKHGTSRAPADRGRHLHWSPVVRNRESATSRRSRLPGHMGVDCRVALA